MLFSAISFPSSRAASMCAGSVPDALPQYTQILVCFRAGAAAAPDVWFDNVSDIVDEETLPSYSSLVLGFFFPKVA